MEYPIFHSQYTAEEIEESIGKVPRINETTFNWEIWDIDTGMWVDTGICAAPALAPVFKHGTITFSSSWSGSAGRYTQTVTVSGAPVDERTKIDIQPTATQLEQLISDGVTEITIENDGGILTAYALGAAPRSEMTVQCVLTELASLGPVRLNRNGTYLATDKGLSGFDKVIVGVSEEETLPEVSTSIVNSTVGSVAVSVAVPSALEVVIAALATAVIETDAEVVTTVVVVGGLSYSGLTAGAVAVNDTAAEPQISGGWAGSLDAAISVSAVMTIDEEE